MASVCSNGCFLALLCTPSPPEGLQSLQTAQGSQSLQTALRVCRVSEKTSKMAAHWQVAHRARLAPEVPQRRHATTRTTSMRLCGAYASQDHRLPLASIIREHKEASKVPNCPATQHVPHNDMTASGGGGAAGCAGALTTCGKIVRDYVSNQTEERGEPQRGPLLLTAVTATQTLDCDFEQTPPSHDAERAADCQAHS